MADTIQLANAIRALSMDAVQAANSGHPGMPMGMADIAVVLWQEFLQHNPNNPKWPNRDRFVVSNGHGSMLPYSLLHLTGYDLPIEQIKKFRQLHSKTPGHPEYNETPGIETTTGPLGQGLANAVGMALAEKLLGNRFNQENFPVFDHYTYAFLGDGCLMEGISHESCSLAGTLKLDKLICFYDDNGISIDGEVHGWFTDNTPERFRAYQWQVIENVDGHNPAAIRQAIIEAQQETTKPTLICCKTVIGFGSPNKQGTAATHGAALGEEEVVATKKQLNWDYAPFEIPQSIYDAFDGKEKGENNENKWQSLINDYQQAYPDLANELHRRLNNQLPDHWNQFTNNTLKQLQLEGKTMATRKASEQALNLLGPLLPELVGGSADLTGSNNTFWQGSVDVNQVSNQGNYIYYGVREFGMTAIANGLTLHGGIIPYTGTFLVFSDYARNAVRMSALIPAPAIHVYTHDSIGLGEDGPTHQPIEHLASLRLIPNMHVWRPCDAVESFVAWQQAIEQRQAPSCLVFSRQNLPHQHRSQEQLDAIKRGGYILYDPPENSFQAIIIATGSEISLAMQTAQELAKENILVRVVSMPCTSYFDQQPSSYREGVIPSHIKARVAIEAGVSHYWKSYVGDYGAVIGIDSFGASAPAKDLFEHFGFSVDNLKNLIKNKL